MKHTKIIAFSSLLIIVLYACQPFRPAPPPVKAPENKIKTNPYPQGVKRPQISAQELQQITDKIYQNETGANPDYLIIWGKGEAFPSLGIGHFIWYPAGETKRFDETFPALISYFIQQGINLPQWLINAQQTGAPWKDKTTFEQSKQDQEFQQLKALLLTTKMLQAQFIFDRIHQSIPQIIQHIPPQQRQYVVNNYNALAHSKGGWYALVDYINFKGKGIKTSERYNHQGWGLLQALQEMQAVNAGQAALNEFSRATQAVLERRVRNSPPENNEQRWLMGWQRRTQSYRQIIE